MYRSFVRCDDPKGVVECGTIRRSKSGSKRMEHKISSSGTQKDSHTSSAYKVDKEQMGSKVIAEEFRSSSSVQLLEVSRGAHKLNQMIESWSKGMSNDGQPKDIAKDLLRGALDLQESLVMLGKLQEASSYVSELKKSQRDKPERVRRDEMWSGRSSSKRFREQNFQVEFQKPRLSADAHPRECIEELREAIRDGLTRQNLLPETQTKRNNRTKAYSFSDIPCSSSKQLSEAKCSNSHPTDFSLQAAPPPAVKGKGPNLIAKLMGLEEFPAKPLQQAPKKELDAEANMHDRRPFFDIEMPKSRKPQPLMQEGNSQERKLKEILETMQFKGLLKSSTARVLKTLPHQSFDSHSKERLADEGPPIVLIKPMRVPYVEPQESVPPMVWEAGAINTNIMSRKMKIKEDLSFRSRERASVASRVLCQAEQEDIPFKRLIQEDRAKDHGEVAASSEEKEIKTVDDKEAAIHADRKGRKMEAEETPVKRPGQEKAVKNRKEFVAKTDEKEVKTKLHSPPKLKARNSASQQPQKKETTDKKVDQVQKAVITSRKPVDNNSLQPKNELRSQDQTKVTLKKLRKPENGAKNTKIPVLDQCNTTSNAMPSKQAARVTTQKSKERKKKEKPVGEPLSPAVSEPASAELTRALSFVQRAGIESKKDDNGMDLTGSSNCACKDITTILADQPSVKEEAHAFYVQTEEPGNNFWSSLCDIKAVTSECEKDAKSPEEPNEQTSHLAIESTSFKNRSHLKAYLLSSASFLAHAEELFDFKAGCEKGLATSDLCNSTALDTELSMDYAYEYIMRRSRWHSQTRQPLWPIYTEISLTYLSLEQLVEEVCRGVETLGSYCKLPKENFPADTQYAILEKDIWCQGMVSGTWDFGWRHGFSLDDAEQAVSVIEKLLVIELIDELLA